MQQLILQNSMQEGPCKGCSSLKLGDPLKKFEYFKNVHISYFLNCNLRCNYCSGHKLADKLIPYDIVPTLEDLYNKGYITNKTTIFWGSGELSIYEYEDKLVKFCSERNIQQHVNTNAVIFSPTIADAVQRGKMTLLVSPDSGTRETYQKIKGFDFFDKQWENIKKYSQLGFVEVKYNVTKDNLRDEDVTGFIEHCVEAGIRAVHIRPEMCAYADFLKKPPNNSLKKAFVHIANKIYEKALENHLLSHVVYWTEEDLREIEAGFYQRIKNLPDTLGKRPLFFWGAGKNGCEMLSFFQENQLDYLLTGFIDANSEKQGQMINNIPIYAAKVLDEFQQKPFVIITSPVYSQEISAQLEKAGFVYCEDYFFTKYF
jgi:molybdenum cofactor biosynthesis enzyme MoaA